MAPGKISVGLLIPSPESRKQVRRLAEATGSVTVEVEAEQYCSQSSDQSARQFIGARPEIILVGMEDPPAAIASLETLQAALPETRLLAVCGKTDPNLIMEAVRAGAREFLTEPLQPRNLSQALDRYVAEKQRKQETKSEGKIYCFTAAKEGSGVTSLAINVATVLAAVPRNRVALIELGSRLGDLALYLNLTPQFKTSDALAAAPRLDSALLDSYMSRVEGLSVLPAAKEFATKEKDTVALDALARLLKVAVQTYTYTIVDTPHTVSAEQMKILGKISESVVVVVNPELSSISRTGHLVRHLQTCGVSENVKLILNRSRVSDEITAGHIEKVLEHAVYFKVPESNKESARATMDGKPAAKGHGTALGRSYHELARQLAGIPKPKENRRLLGALHLSAESSPTVPKPKPDADTPRQPASVSEKDVRPPAPHTRRNPVFLVPRFQVNLRH